MSDVVYLITSTRNHLHGEFIEHRVLAFRDTDAEASQVVRKLEREQTQFETWLEDDCRENAPECADVRRAPRSWWNARDVRITRRLDAMIDPPQRRFVLLNTISRAHYSVLRVTRTIAEAIQW